MNGSTGVKLRAEVWGREVGQAFIIKLLFVTVENPSFDTTQGEGLIATLPLGILDGTDEVIKVGISALCAGEMVGKALRAYPLKFNMVSKGLVSSSQSWCPSRQTGNRPTNTC